MERIENLAIKWGNSKKTVNMFEMEEDYTY